MGPIKIAYQRDLSKSMQDEVYQLEQQAWPNSSKDDYDMIQFLYMKDEHIIGHVGIQIKRIEIDSVSFQVAGICGVIVDQQMQQQGIALRLLQEVKNYLIKNRIDFSIFTCVDHLVSFYEKAGWKKARHSLIGGTKEHPFFSQKLGYTTMLLFCSPHGYQHQELIIEKDIWIPLGKGKLW